MGVPSRPVMDHKFVVETSVAVLVACLLLAFLSIRNGISQTMYRIEHFGLPDWAILLNAVLLALITILFEVFRN